MKRIMIAALGAMLVSSCNGGPVVSSQDIKVTCSAASIAVGAKSTCTAELQENGTKVTPQPASFMFTSSDAAKATVSASGEVTGVAAGETTITASDGTTTSKMGVKIMVTAGSSLQDCPSTISISGLTYTPNACKVKVGASITIKASNTHPLSGSGAGKNVTSQTTDQVIAFTEAGKFDYVCDAHVNQNMKGSITVE
jgi:plastocyanin